MVLGLLYTLTLIRSPPYLPFMNPVCTILQSFINSGDYDDPDDYPDLTERLEAYKRESIISG